VFDGLRELINHKAQGGKERERVIIIIISIKDET
jgi:hypothetical protein